MLRVILLRIGIFTKLNFLATPPQKLSFLSEMHQNASGWGSAPDPAGGAFSAPPDPLDVTREGKGGEGKGGEGRGEEGRGLCDFAPPQPQLPGYATEH